VGQTLVLFGQLPGRVQSMAAAEAAEAEVATAIVAALDMMVAFQIHTWAVLAILAAGAAAALGALCP